MKIRSFPLAVGIAVASVSTTASAVGTGILFKVDESVVPGSVANIITADLIDYSYSAVINQLVDGDGLLNFTLGDTFTETGTFEASSFKRGNPPSTQPAQLNSFGPAGYKILGSFSGTGIAGVVGIGIKAIFTSFTMSLSLDHNADGIADILLGTGVMDAPSEANIFGGLANGDFDVQMLFNPTAFGETYFIDPKPFKVRMETTGNTTTINGATLGAFTADVDGSGNLFLKVPEPASLALIGLGLFGLSTMRRRSA